MIQWSKIIKFNFHIVRLELNFFSLNWLIQENSKTSRMENLIIAPNFPMVPTPVLSSFFVPFSSISRIKFKYWYSAWSFWFSIKFALIETQKKNLNGLGNRCKNTCRGTSEIFNFLFIYLRTRQLIIANKNVH